MRLGNHGGCATLAWWRARPPSPKVPEIPRRWDAELLSGYSPYLGQTAI